MKKRRNIMGAFYGAIHVKSEYKGEIKEALKKINESTKARFYISPVIDGWVGVYPDNHGQDEIIAEKLTAEIKNEIIQLIVHDDDVFIYTFHKNGKLIDRYNSNPDYFGEASEEEKKHAKGNPVVFSGLFSSDQINSIEELLDPDNVKNTVFTTELLAAFSDIFGLPNTMTSYEYLDNGETGDVREWDEFEKIG